MKVKNVTSALKMKEIYVQRSMFERKSGKISGRSLEIEFKRGKKQLDENLYHVLLDTCLQNTAGDFSLEISVVGVFDISQVEESMRETLLDKNAYAILFPFVRSQVTLLTSQPGMQPIVLPAININAMVAAATEVIED